MIERVMINSAVYWRQIQRENSLVLAGLERDIGERELVTAIRAICRGDY